YFDGRCAMGMRRLSIIDLDGGKQPIHDEARRVFTVFNGEIYNYRELRGQLEARGHRFATSSDTEVIVHLYEDRGEAFVEALNATPADHSILEGVRKLEPGHLLRSQGGRTSLRRYWDLRPTPRRAVPPFEDAAVEVRSRIREAVRSHLVADVPVGAFLSGGIDS